MALGSGVRIPIDVDPAGAIRGIRTTERHLDGLSRKGSHSLGLLKGAGLGAAAAIGTGLALAVQTGVREMLEAESVMARTRNVIETTGGKAQITAGHVEDLANKLQKLTGTEDDVIQSAANVVLTFDKLGKKGGVFDRTVALANDMSIAMGTDIEGAARKLGRALQDPERGLGALTRAGITFTDKQRERIKRMAEEGDLLGAQKLILKEVEDRYKGAASSQGKTTEAVQKAQRTFEEFTQTIVAKVMPVLADIIEWARENWPEFKRQFEAAFKEIRPIVDFFIRHIGRFFEHVKQVFRLVSAILRGDWSEAWKAAKAIVRNMLGDILDLLKTIPAQIGRLALRVGKSLGSGILEGLVNLGRLIREKIFSPIGRLAKDVFNRARDIGIEIINGIVQGIKDAAGRIASAVVDAVRGAGSAAGGAIGGFFGSLNPFASGGTVPGELGEAMPIIAHGGEVVLNPRQQQMLGQARIMEVLRRTGGIVGGPGSQMKTGGVLGPAIDFARAQVGEPYQWGAGHAFGDFSSWDCSGFASNVAARIPGYTGGIGTTYTLAPKSSPARGNEPVVFGFRPGHMGIRVAGTWYDAGSGGVEVGDSRWDSLKVPPGLQYLSGLDPQRAIASGDGPDAGPRITPDKPTPLQSLTRALGAAGFGKASGTMAKAILKPTPDVSSGDLPGFSGAQQRGIDAAGRTARHAARVAGKSPDQVAQEGEDAEREAERKALRRMRGKKGGDTGAYGDLKKLRKRKADLLDAFRKLGRSKPGNEAGRAAKRRAMAQMRAKLRELTEEINDVISEIAEINARLAELREEVEAEQYEDAYEAATAAATEAAPATETPATPAEAGISADAAAQIAQAEERARVAARGQAISDSFLRTLFGSGSIDPRAGAVTVNINTLHPGDPALQGEIASWIVGVLGGQGSVPASAFGVGL